MDELIEAAQGRIVNLYKDEAIADLDFDFRHKRAINISP